MKIAISLVNKLRKISDKRINKIEKIIGNGNPQRGSKKIKELLHDFVKFGFTPAITGKMLNKDRHVIYDWFQRYNLKYSNYSGDKPSLLKITLLKEGNNLKFPRIEKIDEKLYKVYYIYPNNFFVYLLGVIFGDGCVDKRKIYISGKSYKFLNSLRKKIKESNLSEIITPKLRCVDSYWRLYIYWSALTRTLNNKSISNELLRRIWSLPNLFNSFTAGLMDTDGYFVYRKGKPERIELGQTVDKWWFPLFIEKLKQNFLIKCYERARHYKIENNGKIYTDISKSINVNWYMSSWTKLIDEIILPFCINPDRLEKALIFKQHSIETKNRFHVI